MDMNRELNEFDNNGYVDVAEHEQNTLQLWPNPTSGQISFETTNATDIKVIDLQGRCVAMYSLRPGINSIDLGNLPIGLYFIKETRSGIVRKVMVRK